MKNKTNNPNGRPKGAKNRRTLAVDEIAARFEKDPLEILLMFAHRDWKALGYKSGQMKKITKDGVAVWVDVISPELQQVSAKDAAKFIHPQKKAIDVRLPEDSVPIIVNFNRCLPKEK